LNDVLRSSSRRRLTVRLGELQELWSLWEQALRGTRQLAVVHGEPGAGKSTLVSQMAVRAFREGAVVLYGRCAEHEGSAYSGLADVMDHIARYAVEDWLSPDCASMLATAFPSPAMHERAGRSIEPVGPDGSALDVGEGIDGLLSRIARDRPVLLIVDDVQWADRPTLLSLDQLVRSERSGNLAIVATMRSDQTDGVPENRRLLREMVRDPARARRIRVAGLRTEQLVDLVRARHAEGCADGFVDALARLTEGNPLLVHAVLDTIPDDCRFPGRPFTVADLAHAPTPEAAWQLLGASAERLSPTTRKLLSVAAVLGYEFDVLLLSRIADQARETVEVALGELIDARQLLESNEFPGHFAFTHDLVRHAALDQLDPAHRSSLHWATFRQLQATQTDEIQAAAYHAWEGRESGRLSDVYQFLVAAADQANQLGMPDRAEQHLCRALSLLDSVEATTTADRLGLLLKRGEALYALGRVDQMRGVGRAAFDLAMEIGKDDALPDALIFLMGWFDSDLDHSVTVDVGLALEKVPRTSIRTRVEILSHLAFFTEFVGDHEAANDAIKEGKELAQAGDEWVKAWALGFDVFEVRNNPDPIYRMAFHRNAAAVGSRLGNHLLRDHNELMIACTLIEMGQRDELDAHLARVKEAARQERRTSMASIYQAIDVALTTAAGDLITAARIAEERYAATGYQPVDEAEHRLRLMRCAELAGTLLPEDVPDVGSGPRRATVEMTKAVVAARRGDMEPARRVLERLEGRGIDAVTGYIHRRHGLCRAAELCALAGSDKLADAIEERLGPWSGSIGIYDDALWIDGAIDRYLGILASLRRDRRLALQRLEAACKLEASFGAHLLAAESQHWFDRVHSQ
jgi:hypothetical protein